MARIYKLSLSGLKLIYKVRHHKGYGIHSPFVYNLVHNVIEEKRTFYAYEDIRSFLTDYFPDNTFRTSKHDRLVFRLINHFKIKSVLEIGSGTGEGTLYITAPSNEIKCFCFEADTTKKEIAEDVYLQWDKKNNITSLNSISSIFSTKIEAVIIDLNNYSDIDDDFINFIKNIYSEKMFVLVKGIRNNKKHKRIWSKIAEIEERTAKLDLFNIGIIFFHKDLYRWNYQISF